MKNHNAMRAAFYLMGTKSNQNIRLVFECAQQVQKEAEDRGRRDEMPYWQWSIIERRDTTIIFVVTDLLLYHCHWLFCQFIDSLQLICFFLIFQFLIPLKKKTKKEWTTDNKSNNNVMSLFSFKAGGQILLEQRELQRAFKAWKDTLARSI